MKNKTKILIMSVIIGVMFLCSGSYAATRTWVGGTSDEWNNADNWLEGAVPDANDDVRFDLLNALQGCIINTSTTIHSLYIETDFGYTISIPSGTQISITGDINLEGGPWATIWDNSGSILLNGTGDQHITLGNYANWTFYNLYINKTSGRTILHSNVIVAHAYSLVGELVNNGYAIAYFCIAPVTGPIYHQ